MDKMPLTPQAPGSRKYPIWSDTLNDQSHVLIRPISKLDKEAERAFIEGLSSQARQFRFLGQVPHPSEQMLEQFTDIDYLHDAAFVAVIHEDSRERIVGISRYSADHEGLHCEFAVTVTDQWQNKGLGTLLMKYLIDVARARGILTMTSIDSAMNMQMKYLARHLGFDRRIDPEDATQVIHELHL